MSQRLRTVALERSWPETPDPLGVVYRDRLHTMELALQKLGCLPDTIVHVSCQRDVLLRAWIYYSLGQRLPTRRERLADFFAYLREAWRYHRLVRRL